MTVAELIEILEGMPQGAEVRIASQPGWPMQHLAEEVVAAPSDAAGRFTGREEDCVWIVEGEQPEGAPYLPGHLAAELGWRT